MSHFPHAPVMSHMNESCLLHHTHDICASYYLPCCVKWLSTACQVAQYRVSSGSVPRVKRHSTHNKRNISWRRMWVLCHFKFSYLHNICLCCGYCATSHVAVCCSVLQCVAACCSVLQRVAVCCSVLQRVAVCCIVLQSVAACCSVLQCLCCGYCAA